MHVLRQNDALGGGYGDSGISHALPHSAAFLSAGTAEVIRFQGTRSAKLDAGSADALISIDANQRITAFNDVASIVFGYSAEEIVGASLEVLIPERHRTIHRDHVSRFAAGPSTVHHMGQRGARIFGQRKTGEEFPAEAAISKLEVDGRTLLTVCLRDISEQQRNEAEQRLLAEVGVVLVGAGADYDRLLTGIANVIVHHMADWCMVDLIEASGISRTRIAYSDERNLTRFETLEAPPTERNQLNGHAEATATRPQPMLMSNPSDSVLESLAHTGAHLQLLRSLDLGSVIILPLTARGHALGTLALGSRRARRPYDARDVQQAEHLAGCLALAADNARLHGALQRAVQVRDEVLAMVAHDLRNPLNTIILCTQTLRRLAPAPERRDQGAADIIHRSTMTMRRLIEDLLDVSRLDAGHSLAISPEALATANILTEAVERQLAAHPASHRQIGLDVVKSLPVTWADRARLLQVFDNLLGNAMKFCRRQLTLGAGRRNEDALFWVTDDGPGIEAENLPHLFDRFWQASKADRAGAGIGLPIAKGIIQAHGGKMWVESQINVGTTFFFTLPGIPAQHEAPLL